ncbi:MAG TPA: GGDEF domain-containing protein, partial [Candidatus Norongarragalinales archaeon]|nr:GGDEF domain-containing protein [Candidatus Norongarragalinales archaeon]
MAINSSKWSFRDSLRRFADVRRSPAINGVKIAWRSTDRLFRWQDSPTLRMVSAIAGWYRRRPPRVRSALALAPIVNTPAAYYYFSLAHQQNNFGDMLHQMVQHPEQAVPLIMAIGANLFGAKYSAFRERALLDPLTGVLRADVFHSRMGRALKGLGRRGRTASVAFFDLDNFKTINDTLGHGHGDNILRIFSRHLREWVRSNDIVGRTGGDEFEVVFPKITKEDLDRRAGQIREQMQKSV